MLKKIRQLKLLFIKQICITFYNKRSRACNINGLCRFNGNEIFGDNVNFNGCKVFGRGVVRFGNNFHSASGLKILTSFHNYKGKKIPYDETVIVKDVTIGDNVWIGMDVLILGGVTIGEGAIIQAGSVVSQSIPALSIAGGNPAKPFKQRDKERYDELKAANKVL